MTDELIDIEPVAYRYGFDGYGWQYIDNGSGSDWRSRHPDGEPLYAHSPVDRIEALEAALSWALIQLGSETGYNMESPIWHAYDRARDVLNGVRK